MTRETRFGSLDHFEKGGVQPINDHPKNYVFSNIFEVASRAEPYEKIAVGENLKYVLAKACDAAGVGKRRPGVAGALRQPETETESARFLD